MIVAIPPLCNCLSFAFLPCLRRSTLAFAYPIHCNLTTKHFGPNHLRPMFVILGFVGLLLDPFEVFGREIAPFPFDGSNRETLSSATPVFQQLSRWGRIRFSAITEPSRKSFLSLAVSPFSVLSRKFHYFTIVKKCGVLGATPTSRHNIRPARKYSLFRKTFAMS